MACTLDVLQRELKQIQAVKKRAGGGWTNPQECWLREDCFGVWADWQELARVRAYLDNARGSQ